MVDGHGSAMNVPSASALIVLCLQPAFDAGVPRRLADRTADTNGMEAVVHQRLGRSQSIVVPLLRQDDRNWRIESVTTGLVP
jgi:hypothetical protein